MPQTFWTNQMANNQAFHGYHLWIATYGARRADGGFERRSAPPIVLGMWPAFSIWQNAVKPGVVGITGLVGRDDREIPICQVEACLAEYRRDEKPI